VRVWAEAKPGPVYFGVEVLWGDNPKEVLWGDNPKGSKYTGPGPLCTGLPTKRCVCGLSVLYYYNCVTRGVKQVLTELVEAAQSLPDDEALHNSVVQVGCSLVIAPLPPTRTLISGAPPPPLSARRWQ